MALFRIAVCWLAVVAVGCTSTDDGATGTASGGAGGGAGSGAAGGATGGAGGAGGDSSGGSGGASGGSGGSGAVGGAAGAGGTAGSGAAAGASGQGASAGAGGTAGAGGAAGGAGSAGATSITPRCDALCDDIVASGCMGAPTREGCLLTCRVLTSSSTCHDLGGTYFDCVDSGTVECDANDEPFVRGCGIAYLQAIGCAVSANPNPSVVAPCDAHCDRVVAAGCALSGTKDECTTNCLWLGATGTGCDDEWSAYLSCATGNSSYVCLLGFASPLGCGSEFTAYSQCIDAAGM